MRTWIAVASTALFLLAWVTLTRLEPNWQKGILPTEPPTPYIHYSPDATQESRGIVLVVHGLDATKETMRTISASLVDAGFEVYTIDLPGHGDSPVGFDANTAREAIRHVLLHIGPESIVLGHSLGAGLLLDLAGDQQFSTMVLLSPPPLPVDKVLAGRALVITGAFDVGRIRAFAPQLADMGNPRIETWTLPWAAHSSAIVNPMHIRRIVDWLGADGSKVKTAPRLALLVIMLASGIALGIALLPGTAIRPELQPIPALLVRYVAACLAAILILKVFVPLSWLRLFATDYLIGFLFVAGLILSIHRLPRPRINRQGAAAAIGAAAFVIVVLGLIAGSHILHMTLSDGRWWRFPFIAAAGFPLFLADETTIRKIHPQWKAVGTALATRVLLGAFLVTGVLLLNREAAFLVLIAHLIVFFWIALWFGAHVVHRHTQNPFAAALFAALVQGWSFAAWFVIR